MIYQIQYKDGYHHNDWLVLAEFDDYDLGKILWDEVKGQYESMRFVQVEDITETL